MNQQLINPASTNDQIIERMKQCHSIREWNDCREEIKLIRDTNFVSLYIDNGLIGQTNIK